MMVSRTWLAALLAAARLSPVCSADDADALDVPSVDNYLRRVFARESVIGDWAYFDGGEVSQYIDSGKNTTRPSSPMSSTLSIDLSKSWRPADVEIKQTRKGAPSMMRQAIFTDAPSKSFYIWGGFASYGAKPPPAELWKFSADGSGGGSWSTEINDDGGFFTRLIRSQGGAYVTTPDSGFYFGGYSDATTDSKPGGAMPGFLQFNYTATDQPWTNHTDVTYSTSGNTGGASAHYVPGYGPNGLVMIFGGRFQNLGSGGGRMGWLDFGTIHFMDPVTKKWYSQKTGGNAPGARMWHCTVGALSPNNTYEIFVFGGSNMANEETYDEVHVLSLPGFVWKKADYAPRSPRDCMSCLVAGQRQMVTFGGIDRWRWGDESKNFFRDPDPFPQGVGVFDLTDLTWKDEYDAAASGYDSPEAVKTWYSEGNIASVEYSEGVEGLMKSGTAGSVFFPGSDPGADSGSTSAGAIAGGVVGGVVGVALIGLAAFCLMRRRKRRQKVPAEETGVAAAAAAAAEAPAYPQEMEQSYSPNPPPSTTVAPSELQADHRDHSPYSVGEVPKMMQPPELDAQDPRYGHAAELDASETRR